VHQLRVARRGTGAGGGCRQLGTPAVSALLDSYFRYLEAEKNLSPYTMRNYRTDLQHFFGYLVEVAELEALEVDRQVFRGYLAHLKDAGFASASVTRKVSTVHSFYRYLLNSGQTDRDLLSGVGAPKRVRKLPAYLQREQLTALIESADGDTPQAIRDRALLELLYAAGVRVSEVAGADLKALDLAENSLLVRGKGNKERMVLIGQPAADALRRYLAEARPRLQPAAGETALFLNRDGTRLSARSVQLIVQRHARKAGLPQRVWPHLLRHTFATDMVDGGAELRVVQELLGHSNANTTQIYLHVTEELHRKNYNDAFYAPARERLRQTEEAVSE